MLTAAVTVSTKTFSHPIYLCLLPVLVLERKARKNKTKLRVSTDKPKLLPSSNSEKKEDGEGEQMDSYVCIQCFITAAPTICAGRRYYSGKDLHVGAEVMAGLKRLPASERDEP